MLRITLILFLIFTMSPHKSKAQVGIGTTSPDDSAVLDINVSNLADKQGFLPPRLTIAQRNSIASPPAGLTIFNITKNAIEFADGTNWVDLSDKTTVAVNDDPAPSGEGDIGIGTETPDANAIMDLSSTDKGLLLPRMTDNEKKSIDNPTKGMLIYNTTTKCIQWYTEDSWFDACNSD